MEKKTARKNSPHLLKLNDTVSQEITLRDINLCVSSPYFYAYFQKKHPDNLHAKIFLNLTHIEIPESKAKLLWKKIVAHMHTLNDTLQRRVGITVASVDYFTNINTSVLEPVLIDKNTSSNIVLSSIEDELTQLYTKEFLEEALAKEIETFYRNSSSFCFVMIDIDDFKKINDQFGHLKGDQVLKKIGEIINRTTRKMDIAARYGGEEIAIIMPHCSTKESVQISERIRSEIEKCIVFDNVNVTVSIGISCMGKEANTKENLIEYADIAMYTAKGHGKNQVSVYESWPKV